MHPLLQDFLAVVMDTMTRHIKPQYKHAYHYVLLVCSIILLFSKVNSSITQSKIATLLLTALPLRGYISVILTVSFPLSEISLFYLLVLLYVFETSTYSYLAGFLIVFSYVDMSKNKTFSTSRPLC